MSDTANPADLAYLAGIVDADGYVTATMSTRRGTTYFGAQVGVTGSRREPHDLAASIFGGKVSAHSPGRGREHHRTQFHWQLGGRRAVPAITAVLPYLRIKHVRAELVLDLQEQVDLYRECDRALGGVPWMSAGWDPTPSLRALVEDIRACGVRSSWQSGLVGEDTP